MVLTWLQREPSRILTEYLTSGDFVEAALENRDSEFLQTRGADRVPVSKGLVGVQAAYLL
jgi:hypothetical protein